VASLLANTTDFSCGSLGPFLGQIKGGTLRALISTTAERMTSLPDTPTARELGYADMEAIVGWSAIFGPPNMPASVRDKLSATIETMSKDPAWPFGTGQTGSLPYITSPDKTKDYVRAQYELYRSLGESLKLIDAKVE
jgi:tripartite-type tricarboxylate transporter receptor subunit TctC